MLDGPRYTRSWGVLLAFSGKLAIGHSTYPIDLEDTLWMIRIRDVPIQFVTLFYLTKEDP